jgi:hypothetical protein
MMWIAAAGAWAVAAILIWLLIYAHGQRENGA